MKNKYILGGGIAGLIFAYYNPSYTIISQDVGGKLLNSFMSHIVYLHDSKETRELLEALNIKYTLKTQLIKYYKNNKVLDIISTDDKKELIIKKMGDTTFNIKDFTLSTSDYYISILDVNFDELITKLKENVKIIPEKIIRILDTEIITDKTSYQYSSIVSTLPANIFWQLYNKPLTLKSKEITFVLADKQPIDVSVDYGLMYCIDTDKAYTRISKKDNTYLYEFTGAYTKDEVLKQLPADTKILEYYVDKTGILYTDNNNIPPKNVLFVGRFAKWEHSQKIKDVINDAIFDYDFRHIWNRQKSFSKNRIDFNTLKDSIAEKQEETKSLLLHLFGELAEVLNEINYKKHKKEKTLDI